ncbi:hypothetical protein DdX_12555 [Ditylenchus destructor]|uniref:C2H2-type domain-containing protein n=1 Tax=Ditylenchus destructor TaxID=166010 RepID=A0AAD4MXH0_9BILA|nr:hypothetical protein DdX_12555 [Ditylenchus destructor]
MSSPPTHTNIFQQSNSNLYAAHLHFLSMIQNQANTNATPPLPGIFDATQNAQGPTPNFGIQNFPDQLALQNASLMNAIAESQIAQLLSPQHNLNSPHSGMSSVDSDKSTHNFHDTSKNSSPALHSLFPAAGGLFQQQFNGNGSMGTSTAANGHSNDSRPRPNRIETDSERPYDSSSAPIAALPLHLPLTNTDSTGSSNASTHSNTTTHGGDLLVPSNDKEGWCRNKKYIQIVKKGYRCIVCNKVYGRYNSVSYHVTIYHRNPPIKCEEDGCQFTTREARYIHFHKYYRHQIPLPASIDLASRKCPMSKCKHVSKSPAMLEKHIHRHVTDCLKDGVYRCASDAGAIPNSQPSTPGSPHLQNVGSPLPSPSGPCAFECGSHEEMFEHLRSSHGEPVGPGLAALGIGGHDLGLLSMMSPKEGPTPPDPVHCLGETVPGEPEESKRSVRKNLGPASFRCELCAYRGRTLTNLEQHKSFKHSSEMFNVNHSVNGMMVKGLSGLADSNTDMEVDSNQVQARLPLQNHTPCGLFPGPHNLQQAMLQSAALASLLANPQFPMLLAQNMPPPPPITLPGNLPSIFNAVGGPQMNGMGGPQMQLAEMWQMLANAQMIAAPGQFQSGSP